MHEDLNEPTPWGGSESDETSAARRSAGGSGMPVPAKAPLAPDTQELPATVGQPSTFDLDELDDDWDDDDEADRRLDAQRRTRARRITGALALVAALGIGFAGGVVFQKHSGSTNSTAAGGIPNLSALRSAFAAARGGGGSSGGALPGGLGGGAGAGGFGGSFGGANSVVGSVSAVADGTLYISEGSSSALVKVVTGPTSTVSVPSTGSVADIQPGDTVVVSGAKQKDGSYMAATITDRGATSSTSSTAGSAAPAASAAGG